jgi:ribonuclease-3
VNKSDFKNKTGYEFRDPKLLQQAVTHSSYTRDKNLPRTECNERLEFLGDAFFDAIIGEELYDRFPEKNEGSLTQYRAQIVCENSLAETGRRLGVGDMLRLGKGEEQTGGRHRESIIADATEAIIGAVYKDSGYEKTRDFVLRMFAWRVEDAVNGKCRSDYKSAFQERVQSQGQAEITYEMLKEEGPDHAKTFYVEVRVDGTPCGRGRGHSKKEAEQHAAREAILKGDKDVL